MGQNAAAKAVIAPSTPAGPEGDDPVLKDLNNFLEGRGFTLLTGRHLPNMSIEGVTCAHDTLRWYSVVELAMRDIVGSLRNQPMRFCNNTATGRRAAMLIVEIGSSVDKSGRMVDSHLVTAYQYRPPISLAAGVSRGFTTEFPRAFVAAELTSSIFEGVLRHRNQRMFSELTDSAREDVVKLLGNEVGALTSHATIHSVKHLGSYAEWDEAMSLVNVVLVRMVCPKLQELVAVSSRGKLGPEQMKLHLYPFWQLYKAAERKKSNFSCTYSVAGLALAYGYLVNQGILPEKDYSLIAHDHTKPALVHTKNSRLLDSVNKILIERGHRRLEALGCVQPGAEFLSAEENPWFACDEWEIMRFKYRMTTGKDGTYYIRFLRESFTNKRETFAGVVNGKYLLAVTGGHLPLLTDTEEPGERLVCARTPYLTRRPREQANFMSKALGQSGSLKFSGPGEDGSFAFFKECRAVHRSSQEHFEDTGSCAVAGLEYVVDLSTSDPWEVLQRVNQQEQGGDRLTLIDLTTAIESPDAVNVRDIRTLAVLTSIIEAREHL